MTNLIEANIEIGMLDDHSVAVLAPSKTIQASFDSTVNNVPPKEHSLTDLIPTWKKSATHEESTIHQLAPYIGKLKSTIARDLISTFTSRGDLVADIFAGSGTVLLESVRLGRRAFGVDLSPYAGVLSRGKLSSPNTLEDALQQARTRLEAARLRPPPDSDEVPSWVKDFFHPQTLDEAINFAKECQEQGDDFLLACLLGILHHQRPGFLSYPSSHLTPYLRDKKFPRDQFPGLYEYRALEPRLIEKIKRAYKRKDFVTSEEMYSFIEGHTELVDFPEEINCIITSPPYMNALDYGRDNRLRLWFIDRTKAEALDKAASQQKNGFELLMRTLANQAEKKLVKGGHCIIIIGEQIKRRHKIPLSDTVKTIFNDAAPNLVLTQSVIDHIPDVRRARRDCRGVRNEHFLVFRKNNA